MLRLDARDFLDNKRPWNESLEDYTIDQLILLLQDKETEKWKRYMSELDSRMIITEDSVMEKLEKIRKLIKIRDDNIQHGLQHLEELVERDIFSKLICLTRTLMDILFVMDESDLTKSGLLKMLEPYKMLYLEMEFLQKEFFFTREGPIYSALFNPLFHTKRHKKGDYSKVHKALLSFKCLFDTLKGTMSYDMKKLLQEAQEGVKTLNTTLKESKLLPVKCKI